MKKCRVVRGCFMCTRSALYIYSFYTLQLLHLNKTSNKRISNVAVQPVSWRRPNTNLQIGRRRWRRSRKVRRHHSIHSSKSQALRKMFTLNSHTKHRPRIESVLETQSSSCGVCHTFRPSQPFVCAGYKKYQSVNTFHQW